VGSLLDEANFKQTPMFSTSLIKSDDQAVRMARVLKELGVKPEQPDNLNQTPLYYASREGKLQLIEYLINEGNCNVNHVDTYGQSPVFYACREGHIEAIKKLVAFGADSDLVDNNGQTPIYYAIKGTRLDVAEYLL
jgi:ankyrin repeat protein